MASVCWLFIFRTPSRVPDGTPSACANRAAYPDPPPVVPRRRIIEILLPLTRTVRATRGQVQGAGADHHAEGSAEPHATRIGREIRREIGREIGWDTCCMPVARLGAPSVHHLQHASVYVKHYYYYDDCFMLFKKSLKKWVAKG